MFESDMVNYSYLFKEMYSMEEIKGNINNYVINYLKILFFYKIEM